MKLLETTGTSKADEIIAEVVSSFRSALADDVRGFYVAGSYAEGTPLPDSDIDLVVVLRQSTQADLARRVADECIARSPLRLDLVALTAAELEDGFVALIPSFKTATLLVDGEDMRDELVLPPLAVFAAAWADRARRFMAATRRVEIEEIRPSVGYPDPTGEFFGYDRATIGPWYPPGTTRSTKELVAIVGSVATTLVALRGGAYVPTKGKCARLYADHVGDEWTQLVNEVHAFCRGRLRYGVPKTADERARLRAICAQVLAFEQQALLSFENSDAATE
jgi:predicted nucleotidyltransferase